MILYGASGHGKVVYSLLRESVFAFFDDNPTLISFMGCQVTSYHPGFKENDLVIITIGDNRIRQKVTNKVKHYFGIVIADSALIDHSVTVGKGSQILHNSLLQIEVKIGNHVIVNSSASVDHECIISDYVHLGPNSTLCGNVKVGEGTLIGAGAVILPGVSIGKWCVIGGGCVVRKDVPDGAVVVGNPSNRIK